METTVTRSTVYRQTPSATVAIAAFETLLPVAAVTADYARNAQLCKDGCVNFGRKWSCPPASPSFASVSRRFTVMTVLCYRITLDTWPDLHPFRAIKAANAVMKSELEKWLRGSRSDEVFPLGTGSCRACKPCAKGKDLPCAKPEKRLYSLEATGVDAARLVHDCFGFPLQWYQRDAEPPEYTCAVCGILHNDPFGERTWARCLTKPTG